MGFQIMANQLKTSYFRAVAVNNWRATTRQKLRKDKILLNLTQRLLHFDFFDFEMLETIKHISASKEYFLFVSLTVLQCFFYNF